jgi:hypothetical protein
LEKERAHFHDGRIRDHWFKLLDSLVFGVSLMVADTWRPSPSGRMLPFDQLDFQQSE